MRVERLLIVLVCAVAAACGGGAGGGGGDDDDSGPVEDAGPDGGGGGGGGDDDAGVDGDGGTGAGCGLRTCESASAECGLIGDGCDSTLDCGGCDGLETCGGGGEASECGGNLACLPLDCDDVDANCGPIGDGCGGVVASCGTCVGEEVCGGGGVPSVCSDEAAPPPCEGLCLDQVDCGAGPTTSVSGTVYTPAGGGADAIDADYVLPLYNVTVYVPNGTVEPFTTGNDSCLNCDAPVTGDPLVMTTTDAEGNFSLTNMPVGTDIPLVIQAGKWRRVITIDSVAQCADTPLAPSLTRFPRTQGEFSQPLNNIPKVALTTGGADALECLLPKIGIAAAEFTQPVGAGRVNLYGGHNGTNRYVVGVNGGATFPDARTLWDSATDLNDYDMVILSCEGADDWPLGEPDPLDPEPDTSAGNRGFRDQSDLAAMKDYLDLYGGRVFASHWHHSWVEHAPAPMNAAGTFTHRSNPPQTNYTVTVNQLFVKGAALAQWLVNVGASTALGQIVLAQARHTVDAVDEDVGFKWIHGDNPNVNGSAGDDQVPYMSFNTPTDADDDEKCGRMVVTDIHVSNTDDSAGSLRFPTGGCTSSTLLPEEKALIFMLFDLASCVTTDIPECEPLTECPGGANACGQIADGCGGLLDCGLCEEPDTCGGGGVHNQCGNDGCEATTCEAEGADCGPIADGCGGSIECGDCTLPETCGGGGTPNVCGYDGVD